MREYHKINTVFKRDPEKKNTIITAWAHPALDILAENEHWTWTEKVDGTNIRVHWDGENVTFGGRTDRAQIPAVLVARLQNIFKKETMSAIFEDKSITLYGEGFGSKIQKGGGLYEMPVGCTVDFILFDAFVEPRWWLERKNLEEISESLNIPIAPIVYTGDIESAAQHMLDNRGSCLGKRDWEGLVGRMPHELFDRAGQRLIFKLKIKDFERYYHVHGTEFSWALCPCPASKQGNLQL